MRRVVQELIERNRKQVNEFEKVCIDTIIKIAETIIESIKKGGCVYLCGNGGSAADCQHIAGELLGRFRRNRKPLPAVALSTDTSVITCISNDYTYEDVFARQTEAMLKDGDILWAFSTSGESPNIIKAAGIANKKGVKVIAFTGKRPSKLESLSDLCICSNTDITSTAQEIHMLAYHIICEIIDQQFTD